MRRAFESDQDGSIREAFADASGAAQEWAEATRPACSAEQNADNNGDGITNDRPSGLQRNTVPGPGFINLDLNVAHDFVLFKSRKEAQKLSVSLSSFNVLNHRNDLTYVGVITSPFFGSAVQSQPPRRIQLGLQYNF